MDRMRVRPPWGVESSGAMPDKTGPTECSLNLNPNSALEATQVVVSEDAVSLQGQPTLVVCSLEL